MNDTNMVMGWDDTLENDGAEYLILEPGDYNFEVISLERGTFPGSARIPQCNKATITVKVDAGEGKTASCKFDLILYRSLEWKLSAFFRCIGQKQHGEKLVMNWNKVEGAKGRAHFCPRIYTTKSGEQRQANDLVSFFDYDPQFFPPEPFIDASGKVGVPWE